ncbi:MAG: sigma-70 family RNA polymerase sigma factor [Acidobacteriaceae bacterium]
MRDGASNSPEGLPSSSHKTLESPAADRLTAISDEEQLKQIRAGDKEALGTLFRRYARMVRTVARRILRDASEADDLVQDVFLFVFRKASLFDPAMGSVRSWLIQVTWHRAIDRRRHLAARHFYTRVDLEEDLLGSDAGQGLLRFYEDSMEGALGRETLRRIEESLSDDQRRVVRLYFFEGHTVGEIAALLGQTPGNVRNHYYRALEKMRREIFPAQLRKR